jgi:hypothetical protein
MAKVVSFVNSFTAGEIGPDAEDRSDLQQHARGCSEGLNMIGLVTGPQVSRGGFWDRGAMAVEAEPTRIVAFARSREDALFLELGDEIARVWTVAGSLVMDGPDPYQFVTPWTAAQVARLWFFQQGDVLFVTDLDGGPTRVVKRIADDDWDIDLFDFRDGPWLPEDVDGGVTLTASAKTGTVTLTASAASFTSDDIGSLVQLRESDGSPGVTTWTSGTDFSVGDLVQFDGRVYSRAGAPADEDTTGTTPPLHTEGTVSDGQVPWTFVHDGRGVARITAVGGPTSATATVIRPIPSTSATKFWSKQAYSAVEGYPRALAAEREERLVFGSSLTRPGTVDATRTAGFSPVFGDFKPGLGTGRVVDDDAVRLDVGGSERVVWLLAATLLLAGCTGGEYAVSGSQLDEPMTPDTRRSLPVSTYGNADVAPLLIQGPPPAILHVLRSRTVMRETKVSPDLTVESRNLSVLAHHIHGLGMAELAWQQSRNLVWMRLDDGTLAAMTYDMEQQVIGTTRQPLPEGWTVESVAAAPAPNGGDVLAVAVTRTKDAVVQRRFWLLSDRGEQMFMDGAQRYEGPPVTTVDGLEHYAGETVAIVAGGARVPDQVVSVDGEVTVPVASGDIVVGLKARRRHVTLPLDMEGLGSTNGRTLIPTHATVILTCAEALVGTEQPNSAARVFARRPGDVTSPVVRKMRVRVAIGNGSGRDARLVIETDSPFDLILHAYRLEAEGTA